MLIAAAVKLVRQNFVARRLYSASCKIQVLRSEKNKFRRYKIAAKGYLMEEITIRSAKLSDAEKLCEIYAYYVNNTAVTFEDDAPDVNQFTERMQNIMSFYPYFVAESGEEVVGFCYAGVFKNRSAYDWAVETTVYVAKGFNRRGVGASLYAALEKALKSQGIKNMYACIAYPAQEDEHLTADSVNFHKKLGFKMIGRFRKCGSKFGRWYDMVWMEKMIGRHNSDPVRPVSYSD